MTTDLPQIAQRLAARTPAEINSLMVSSARSCGVDLRERTEWRGSYTKPNGEHIPARVERRGWVAIGDAPQGKIESLIDKIDAAMTPATREQIEMWLIEMSVITARRIDAPATEELRVTAYASRLADYPADVAREALVVHPWRFFPTWAELRDVCEEAVKPRREMRIALERAAWDASTDAPRALPDEATRVETADEAAERQARVRSMTGDVLASLNANLARQNADRRERDAETESCMWATRQEVGRDLDGLIP